MYTNTIPMEIRDIAMISVKVTTSLKTTIPETNANITETARKIPSVKPKGFLENIYPTINLEVNAKTNPNIIEKFEMNIIQKFPRKRLEKVLDISILPFFNSTSPMLYKTIATIRGNQKLQIFSLLCRFIS